MFSSNDGLIEEVRQRIKNNNNNNNNNNKNNNIDYIEVRRLTTLIPKNFNESRKPSLLKRNQYYLEDDNNKINLRLIPLVRTSKNLFRLKNQNEKIVKTQAYKVNFSRNFKLKKPRFDSNSNLNTNINTFSNILSTSNLFERNKSSTKKQLYLSPYQIGKNKNRIFKNLINFSKEFHSPKKREIDIDKDNYNLISFIKINNNKHKNTRIENLGISPQIFFEKKIKIKKRILSEVHNLKTEAIEQNKNKIGKIKKQYKKLILGNEIIKNIVKNKKNDNQRRLNCYYNKLHLNKIHNILERFSYNSKD